MNQPAITYSAIPLYESDDNPQRRVVDLEISFSGKVWKLLGRSGAETELRPVRALQNPNTVLPVLLGSGLGHALNLLLEETSGPVAVVDAETPILEITELKARHRDNPRVFWIDSTDPAEALSFLSRWQMDNGGSPFAPIALSLYLRLRPALYKALREAIATSAKNDFWSKARYPKFKGDVPRILLITSQYFLMGEIIAACERLAIPHRFLETGGKEKGCTEFVEELLSAVMEFKPDFVLTINHLGVDQEGVLINLLERLELPLASWFVDNPDLILSLYNKLVSPMSTLFTWDTDNIGPLKELGFEHVSYLPLAADVERFFPGAPGPDMPAWHADVSFVGNSMVGKTRTKLAAAEPDSVLKDIFHEGAIAFGASDERSCRIFLEKKYPEAFASYCALQTPQQRLSYETALTWESTRLYRASCLERTLLFSPLIAGDAGWKETFPGEGTAWRWHKELSYYSDLPRYYPSAKINFNCTSLQMKGAVNQRVFDVPACGAFVLTDYREQVEELFELDREIVCFKDQDEIPDLIRYYLKHPEKREAVSQAARERIFRDHTYDHRMKSVLDTMKRIFS